ncbi:MAG TPA: hypothetical protein VJ717_17635 [Gemmatimonadaceae bacterium]|nr:hypothetical protein [Gemmatimonadaceae bacterium]
MQSYAFTPLPHARVDSDSYPTSIRALAGTWRGTFVDEAGSVRPFTLVRDSSPDAAVAGRFLFFVAADVQPTGVRLLDANERAFAALIGPYYDPREDAEVLTVLEGVRTGSRIDGSYYTKLPNWKGTVRRGEFTALRADRANRAA